MSRNKDVLLTFTGFHDPYSLGLIDDDEQPGPILTLTGEKRFSRIVLFATPRTTESTAATRKALLERQKGLVVEIRPLALDDPTDYTAITQLLRQHLSEVQSSLPDHTFFVSVASGTPQMHACWVVLLRDGVFPAQILHVRPPRFVTADRPLVTLIDLTKSLPAPDKSFRSTLSESKARHEMSTPFAEDLASRRDIVPVDMPHARLEIARQKLNIVGDHPKMREVLERVEMAAPTDMNVLILGETGTGKELIALLIHELSERAGRPFVPLNCGAISKDLIESTLFGHAKGAFTGAIHNHAGKFEEANGGTLFLDELGELLPETQVKLLRVIEDGIVHPVGAKTSKKVDVRVVAATNQDLQQSVAQGTFRGDLYYRLNTVRLDIPPLRDRTTDIPKIALFLLDDINKMLRRPKRLSREALVHLTKYPWRGNVRELRNVLTQSAMFCIKDVIDEDKLLYGDKTTNSKLLGSLPEPEEGFDINTYLNSIRKHLFERAISIAGGNQSKAGRLLGVSAQAVNKFVNEMND